MCTVEGIAKRSLRFCHAHECQRKQITTVSSSLFAHDVSQRCFNAHRSKCIRFASRNLHFSFHVRLRCAFSPLLFLPRSFRSAVDRPPIEEHQRKVKISVNGAKRTLHTPRTVSTIPLPCAIRSLKVPIGSDRDNFAHLSKRVQKNVKEFSSQQEEGP